MSRRSNGFWAAAVLSVLTAASAAKAENLASRLPLSTLRDVPDAYGTQDFTVVTISATSFVPHSNDVGFGVPAFFTSPGLGRFCQPDLGTHYYATLNVPAFNDVPSGHPFFQYVEALARSGITGGCGNGNYCPDAAVTRAQMAVFLAKALGLHWPN